MNTLNFRLSHQKSDQLIHLFSSYLLKHQSAKLSEKKWGTARPPVVYLILVVCLRVIFAEAIGVRFVLLQAVKMINRLVVALEMIHWRQRGGGVFIF